MKQSTAIFFIHDFEKRMRDKLRISVQTKYFSKGGACSHVDLDKPHKVNITVADSILNKNLVNDPYGVKEYDFVEALINIAHEAHMPCKRKKKYPVPRLKSPDAGYF